MKTFTKYQNFKKALAVVIIAKIAYCRIISDKEKMEILRSFNNIDKNILDINEQGEISKAFSYSKELNKFIPSYKIVTNSKESSLSSTIDILTLNYLQASLNNKLKCNETTDYDVVINKTDNSLINTNVQEAFKKFEFSIEDITLRNKLNEEELKLEELLIELIISDPEAFSIITNNINYMSILTRVCPELISKLANPKKSNIPDEIVKEYHQEITEQIDRITQFDNKQNSKKYISF